MIEAVKTAEGQTLKVDDKAPERRAPQSLEDRSKSSDRRHQSPEVGAIGLKAVETSEACGVEMGWGRNSRGIWSKLLELQLKLARK